MIDVPLAHGGSAGPNVEALVLAAALIVVGIVFFVQKSAKPIVSVMLVLGGATLGWGGFTFLDTAADPDDGEPAGGAQEGYSAAVDGLCHARDELVADDVEAARSSFLDESHAALHDIADRLVAQDRAAAADVLEAKEAVESGFEDGDDLSGLQRDLDELIIATVRGLDRIDVEVAGCR